MRDNEEQYLTKKYNNKIILMNRKHNKNKFRRIE